jgi:hypothetical protein
MSGPDRVYLREAPPPRPVRARWCPTSKPHIRPLSEVRRWMREAEEWKRFTNALWRAALENL